MIFAESWSIFTEFLNCLLTIARIESVLLSQDRTELVFHHQLAPTVEVIQYRD